MSDSIVLRKVYALDSNTGLFVSTGNILLSDGLGGTTWTNMISSLTVVGGPIIGFLPCTLSSVSSLGTSNTSTIAFMSSAFTNAICSLSVAIASQFPGQLTQAQLVSSMGGLSGLGYMSTSGVSNLISSAGANGQVNPSSVSTIANTLGTLGYVSSLSLLSTVAGLGTATYLSSPQLLSTVGGLGTFGYLSTAQLRSTVGGLGNSGYISTSQLVSTVSSLVGGGLSTVAFTSTVAGLGSAGYISSLQLLSTTGGLSGLGYISTGHLVSTTLSLSSQKANIRFDNTGSVTVIDSVNTFTNASQIIYVSTFYTSSLLFTGRQGTQINAAISGNSNLTFSTAVISLNSFSNFIDANSRVTIELYPTIAFSMLATGATAPAVLPMSTFLQYNNTNLLTTTTTTYVGVTNTYVFRSNATNVAYVLAEGSNIYSQPIRISVPPGTINGNYATSYTVMHYMPGGMNYTPYVNALHSNYLTPYYGSTGSIFVSIQNLV
jgi:hypothetical protein